MFLRVRIFKVRSTVGQSSSKIRIMKSLGFPVGCHVGYSVFKVVTPQVKGMINLVSHLVKSEIFD